MQTKPNFKAGNTLLRLTKYGWPIPYDLRTNMAANWGYALQLDNYDALEDIASNITNTASDEYLCVQLSKAAPTIYPLAVVVDGWLPNSTYHTLYTTNLSVGIWVTNSAGLFVDDNTNTWSSITNKSYTPVYATEGPSNDWYKIAFLIFFVFRESRFLF